MFLLYIAVSIFIISFGIVWVKGEVSLRGKQEYLQTLIIRFQRVYRQDKSIAGRFNKKAHKCI